MNELMPEGLRLDHPTADMYAFLKPQDRTDGWPLMGDAGSCGLIVCDSSGVEVPAILLVEPANNLSHKGFVPLIISAVSLEIENQHIHFISDQNYIINELNSGARSRILKKYRKTDGSPLDDAILWGQLDLRSCQNNIQISAGRPISAFSQLKLDIAKEQASRKA